MNDVRLRRKRKVRRGCREKMSCVCLRLTWTTYLCRECSSIWKQVSSCEKIQKQREKRKEEEEEEEKEKKKEKTATFPVPNKLYGFCLR